MNNKDYLRRAVAEDKEILFNLANEEACRSNSFNSQKIEYEEHLKWLEKKLSSEGSRIYIMISNEETIGQVRIDTEGDNLFIAYSISADKRGQGFGYKILSLLEHMHEDFPNGVKYLKAKVKKENLQSLKIFRRLEYKEEERKNYIEFTKELFKIEEDKNDKIL